MSLSKFLKTIENNWKSVEREPGKEKPFIEGSGPFHDANGRPSIASNTLIRSWRSGASKFLIFFALMWNTIVGLVLVGGFNGPIKVNGTHYSSIQEAYKADPTVLIFLLFPLVGLVLVYISLCFLLNKTKITIEHGFINVKRGPLPWFSGSFTKANDKIKQVYIQQYSSHSQNNRPVVSFRVMAQVLDGVDVCIDKGFSNYSSARILEQWLEQRLRIEDTHVPGEVSA